MLASLTAPPAPTQPALGSSQCENSPSLTFRKVCPQAGHIEDSSKHAWRDGASFFFFGEDVHRIYNVLIHKHISEHLVCDCSPSK